MSRKIFIGVGAFGVVLVVILAFLAKTGRFSSSNAQNSSPEIIAEEIVEGTGPEAQPGKTLQVHFIGTLADGKTFDSTYDKGAPITFMLGYGRVIRGLDTGLVGMKAGGKRKLTVPPSLAYGAEGMGDVIPPNSTLTYEIELLSVD